MMDHIWHFGGGEYYFDISEKACLERITRALDEMKDVSDDSSSDAPEAAERHCRMIAAFFDTVLGGEAARGIIPAGAGAEECSAAYVDFILFVRDEVEAISRIRCALEEKLRENRT